MTVVVVVVVAVAAVAVAVVSRNCLCCCRSCLSSWKKFRVGPPCLSCNHLLSTVLQLLAIFGAFLYKADNYGLQQESADSRSQNINSLICVSFVIYAY